MTDKQTIKLNTGADFPILGLGTWKAEPGQVGEALYYAVTQAGYRHIDGAAIYNNEPEVGAALARVFSQGQVKREEVFITSKLWNTNHASAKVESACLATLKDLRLDYLDLYLMHWGMAVSDQDRGQDGRMALLPISIRETWEAMQQLFEKGLVRAIGVANFTGAMLLDLLSYAKIKPAVNQIELHPYNPQTRLVEYCQLNDIVVTAYSPLGSPGTAAGRPVPSLFKDETVAALASRYGKTPAQILLRWGVERGTVVIPKSIHPDRIKFNSEIFDFSLSADEVTQLSNLKIKQRYVDPWDWWRLPYFD